MKKILIAEDDTITQKLIATIVEKMGYTAFTSPNGRHAYETLQVNDDFSLLITDIMMPEMDGKELIHAVRKDPVYNAIPIIIMSAFVGVKEISNFLESGATVFQPKPIDKRKIEALIQKCLKQP